MIRTKLLFNLTGIFLLFFTICACDDDENGGTTPQVPLQLIGAQVGSVTLILNEVVETDDLNASVVCSFSQKLDESTVGNNIFLQKAFDGNEKLNSDVIYTGDGSTVSFTPNEPLLADKIYTLIIKNGLKGENGASFSGVDFSFKTVLNPLVLESLEIDGQSMMTPSRIDGVSGNFEIKGRFSNAISPAALKNKMWISNSSGSVNFNVQAGADDHSFTCTPSVGVDHLRLYDFEILSGFQSIAGNPFSGFRKSFYSALDTTDKFPRITDEELLTKVQEQTFKYFWDHAHPVSGMARERNTSTNTVTSGGSGFGLMAIVVGMERGFITRDEGLTRFETIMSFLGTADRFHGAWSHWINGTNGNVNPFSPNDDGGDLVETSFLAMGMLTVRQYLNPLDSREHTLINVINDLWESIEWDWYRQEGQNVLYWHWSPNFGWEKNHKVGGYNEALITYIMAASSPTHSIPAEVYHEGWARNGNMVNGNTINGYVLPLGRNKGGPLFFEQYTYLGVDPRNLSDQYANYWTQCVNHSLINRAHCIQNPHQYIGYSEKCWGLTASDGDSGYSAHSPSNDRGVITPTAALSSIAFTPDESMNALHHFYYHLGDKLWGEFGFYDAFNPTADWVASSYIAIDQGPIIGMMENYRTGLLWDLFMSCPEVQSGLDKLGFAY
jgi:hypothetical protein